MAKAKKKLLQVLLLPNNERAVVVNGRMVYADDPFGEIGLDLDEIVETLEEALEVEAQYVETEESGWQTKGGAMNLGEQRGAWCEVKQGRKAAQLPAHKEQPGLALGPAPEPAVARGWRIERPTVRDCGFVGKGSICLSDIAYRKIETALDEMGHSEWLAYLLGTVNGNNAQIEDLLLPEQNVTSCSVAVLGMAEDPPHGPKIIGTVHSHGSDVTSPAFSLVDREHIMGNYLVSLLVGRDYKGVIRVHLPCGQDYYLEAKVVALRPEADEGFRRQLRAKAKKTPPPLTYQAGLDGWNF